MNEFHYAFELDRYTVFQVSYYTLGYNDKPYFTTSACRFGKNKIDYNECGQTQNDLLYGKAREFWLKWDRLHLKDLSEKDYEGIMSDLAELKATYNFIGKEQNTYKGIYDSSFSFDEIKELSKRKMKEAAA